VGVPVGAEVIGAAVGVPVGGEETVGVPVGASVAYPMKGKSPHTPQLCGQYSCVSRMTH